LWGSVGKLLNEPQQGCDTRQETSDGCLGCEGSDKGSVLKWVAILNPKKIPQYVLTLFIYTLYTVYKDIHSEHSENTHKHSP